jgi:hypothetical protein
MKTKCRISKKVAILTCIAAMVAILVCIVVLHSSPAIPQEVGGKVVAKKEGELTVCDRTLLSETISLPLSALTEELQILKLDDIENAWVKQTEVEISDNYLLVAGSSQIPFRLFDRKTGKHIANIGSFGQGPNEYQNVYDQQLDEENDRIYLLPEQTKNILVYDLKGKHYPPIPLCASASMGTFKVDTKDSTVIVSVLPYSATEPVVWQQTTDGKLLKSIPAGHLVITSKLDYYCNHILQSAFGQNYDFHVQLYESRADTLYRYDVAANKLIPIFTMDFHGRPMEIHRYIELPDYFMGEVSKPELMGNVLTTTNERFYILDKKTLKGSFFTLKNDFLGGIEIEWPTSHKFNGMYFVRNIDASTLQDQLTEALETEKNLSPAMRSKITKLRDSITDNDNNYILYAKLK